MEKKRHQLLSIIIKHISIRLVNQKLRLPPALGKNCWNASVHLETKHAKEKIYNPKIQVDTQMSKKLD